MNRYKQIVAQRLAIAGLNVAYGMEEYPTSGPFPVDLKEDGGVVTFVYDQDLFMYDAEIRYTKNKNSNFILFVLWNIP